MPSMAWTIHHQQELGQRDQKHSSEHCTKEGEHQQAKGIHLQRWPGSRVVKNTMTKEKKDRRKIKRKTRQMTAMRVAREKKKRKRVVHSEPATNITWQK